MFWIILIVVVVIIIVIKANSNGSNGNHGTASETDVQETNQRFKEAAERGDEPKDVYGFSALEKNELFRNHQVNVYLKDLCMNLAKNGYYISGDVSVQVDRKRMCTAHISIYSKNKSSYLGYISIVSEITERFEGMMYDKYLKDSFKEKRYIIQDFPWLLIKTDISPPDAPPEWLMICADVLKQYKPPIQMPSWVNENPKAKEFVNVMFQ